MSTRTRFKKRGRWVGKVSKSTKAYVNKAILKSQETKRVRGYATGSEITSTVSFVSLVAISQGDDTNERIGDQVDPMYYRIKGQIKPKSAAGPQVVRFILFQWKPNRDSDAPAAAAELLADPTNQPIYSPVLKQNPQFRVLKDKVLMIPGVNENNRSGTMFSHLIPRKRLSKMKWADNTANTDSGHLYLMLLGENVSGTSALQLYLHGELGFKDA